MQGVSNNCKRVLRRPVTAARRLRSAVSPAQAEGILCQWAPSRWQKWLCALALLVLYLASVSTTWYHTPDSALYLMLGRNLATGSGYTLWGEPHVHVPPGFPLMLSNCFRYGCESLWCMNLAMALASLATILLCYLTLREHVSPGTAMLVSAAFGFGHVMHLASLRVLSDVPFMLVMWLGLWCYTHGLRHRGPWLELGSLMLLVSCSIRVTGVLIVVAAVSGMLGEKRQSTRWRVWVNAAACLAVLVLAAAKLLHSYYADQHLQKLPSYGSVVAKFLAGTVPRAISRLASNTYVTGEHLSEVFSGQPMPPAVAVLVLWAPIGAGMLLALRRRRTLAVAIAVGYLIPLLLLRPLIPRYLLPVAPLLIWFWIEGIGFPALWRPEWRPRLARLALVGALVLIAINLPKVTRDAYWQRQPHLARNYRERVEVEEAAAFLRDHHRPGDTFVCNVDQRRIAYLSGLESIHWSQQRLRKDPPRRYDIQQWQRKGMAFLVMQRSPHAGYQQKVEETCRKTKLQLVFENERYRIYTTRQTLDPGLRAAQRAVSKSR